MVSVPDTGLVYPLLGRPQDSLPDSLQSGPFSLSITKDYS